MFDKLIAWSIESRLFVISGAILLLIVGGVTVSKMPIDVFPDLTAPTVTLLTEAHGLAPEEVETLVTFPIETALNGASGVRRVRSSSGIGVSVVWVEFEWGTDIYIARQIVTEKLGIIRSELPAEVFPALAPVSSIMGEIMFIGLTGDSVSPMVLRDTAEWTIRRRLLALPGVSQVVPIGGELKQYHVTVSPARMESFKVSLDEIEHALANSNANSAGGFYTSGGQEHIIRLLGKIETLRDIEEITVAMRGGLPVLLRHVAKISEGPALKRGVASINGKSGISMGILKQPNANTIELTKRLDQALDEISKTLPKGVTLHQAIFRQADFIQTAVNNVKIALRDGTVLVVIILFLFLLNFRTTFITITAIPLSIITSLSILQFFGFSINTMTLGGLTIAVGVMVDDAIIDVENIFRRLRENAQLSEEKRQNPLLVIYRASLEIRSSIVYATLIVVLVFLPLFFLSGVEGRLLFPLGLAYVSSIFASLLVALTVTPALSAWLLPNADFLVHENESFIVRILKKAYGAILSAVLWLPRSVAFLAFIAVIGAVMAVPHLGRTFLPPFNEGALTLSSVTMPGTSLEESNKLAIALDQTILSFPEVQATSRRTGRAELDEHAMGVNSSEIDVALKWGTRPRHEFEKELRKAISLIPGLIVNIGQPLSHRIDHILSGTRSAVAIKIFGADISKLRSLANQIFKAIKPVRGVVDLSFDQQNDIPQLRIALNRPMLSRYGVTTGEMAERLETIFAGKVVTRILEAGKIRDLVLRYDDAAREDLKTIENTLVDTSQGLKVPLKLLANITKDVGPNTIERENVQRKMVVSCNVAERDLGSVISDIRKTVDSKIKLPDGYYIVYGGQFESEQEATRTIALLSILSILGVFILLFAAFGGFRLALLTMINLPLSLIGGIMAVFLTGGVLSVAGLVGFVTLFGIATRNGIMMILHYQNLLTEGKTMQEAIVQGSMERLSPILMTALTAGMALIPLIINQDAPGNELQAPMAIVILGGLLSSTLLTLLVLPPLFSLFGRAHTASIAFKGL